MKKIYTNTLVGVLIFIACFTVFTLIINQEDPKILFVNGFSMYPAYLPFDMLIIEDVESGEINKGDVVIVDNSVSWLPYKNYVAHRVIIIKVQHDIVIGTKGDNNPERDPLINAEDAIGRVSHHIPFIGYLLAPPFNYIIIFGVVLLVFIFQKNKIKKKT